MLNNFWINDKRRVLWIASISFVVLFLLLGAAFYLKKDSANGRLFMWKTSLSAIADKPLLGHGRGSFPATYGFFQEAYFSGGDFSSQEELVAGSPEYAFNDVVCRKPRAFCFCFRCKLLFYECDAMVQLSFGA